MRDSSKRNRAPWTRRGFIGAAGALAASLSGRRAAASGPESGVPGNQASPRVKAFRTLGRTGFDVSDIGFGSGELKEPELLEAIFDAGVNYVDSSESYGRGQVERTIGRVLARRDRKSLFVTTKLSLGRERTKEAYLAKARQCLERLGTDRIDCLMMHGPARSEDLRTEGFHEAIRELKAEGRVRFCGVSQHGSQWADAPETMESVLLSAAEDGRFDVMLLVYNFIQRDQGERVLKACREKNIGATLMKTNPVLNYMEVWEGIEQARAEGRDVPESQLRLAERLKGVADLAEPFKAKLGLSGHDEVRGAAVRFVLSHPDVHTACLTIKSYADLEFYAALSGASLQASERRLLENYGSTFGTLYCRHACNACEERCPERVPVNTIMRYQHYFLAQGREKTALSKYAALGTRADRCGSCASGACEAACPYGVPIQGFLAAAHDRLTLV